MVEVLVPSRLLTMEPGYPMIVTSLPRVMEVDATLNFVWFGRFGFFDLRRVTVSSCDEPKLHTTSRSDTAPSTFVTMLLELMTWPAVRK